ncbi:type II secretion system F family protein [Corynebacterium sp. UBA2622]|uniref:type II secretion system F family protein n=1 Tax=Corynebacterium sp. UBA2622 TaxID=1946393 RepID=UPI0025C35DB1|nr:type II secretion system F family protein [Corynebacterium sp. UBA2622]
MMWVFFSCAAVLPVPRPARRVAGARGPSVGPAWIPVLVGAAALGVIALDRVPVVLSACVVGATVLHTVVQRREAAEAGRRVEVTAGFLGHLVTNLRAGAQLADATSRAAEHLPPAAPAALRDDIRRAVATTRLGGAPEEALRAASAPELREVGALWGLATSRGLPIADLLVRARDRLDQRQRHRAATEAALAGPKTTAVVLSALPLAGIAMGTAMGADPLRVLLGDGVGGWLLLGGTTLVCAGFLACARIISGAAS